MSNCSSSQLVWQSSLTCKEARHQQRWYRRLSLNLMPQFLSGCSRRIVTHRLYRVLSAPNREHFLVSLLSLQQAERVGTKTERKGANPRRGSARLDLFVFRIPVFIFNIYKNKRTYRQPYNDNAYFMALRQPYNDIALPVLAAIHAMKSPCGNRSNAAC